MAFCPPLTKTAAEAEPCRRLRPATGAAAIDPPWWASSMRGMNDVVGIVGVRYVHGQLILSPGSPRVECWQGLDDAVLKRPNDSPDASFCRLRGFDGIADGRPVTSVNPCSGGNSRRLFITMCSHSVLLLMVTHYLPTPSPVRALTHSLSSTSDSPRSVYPPVSTQPQSAPDPSNATCPTGAEVPMRRVKDGPDHVQRRRCQASDLAQPLKPPSAARIRK